MIEASRENRVVEGRNSRNESRRENRRKCKGMWIETRVEGRESKQKF